LSRRDDLFLSEQPWIIEKASSMSIFITAGISTVVDRETISRLTKRHSFVFKDLVNPFFEEQFQYPVHYGMLSSLKYYVDGLGRLNRQSFAMISAREPTDAEKSLWLSEDPELLYALGDWEDLLKDLIAVHPSSRVGLVIHTYTGRITEDDPGFLVERRRSVANIDGLLLSTLDEDVIYTFVPDPA